MASSSINESIILEEVMTTHDPNSKDFKTNIIFNFVKNILYSTMIRDSIDEDEESDKEDSNGDKFDKEDSNDGKEFESNNHKVLDEEYTDMELPNQLKHISFEILLKSSSSSDVNPHSIVIYFLRMLSTYSWEAKLLMMLAAFSLNFGEFNLVQGHKRLAGKLTILKENESLQVVPSHMQKMVTHFVKSILHLTEWIVELTQSSSYNSAPIIPIACYWIFTNILAYASYFTCLPTTVDSKWLIVEGTQLSDLTGKIKNIISDCRPILEKKREEDCYKALCYAFSYDENPIPSTNNLDVLKLLFNGGKKELIYDFYHEKVVGRHLLKNKSLLLLISSSLDIDSYLLNLFEMFQWRTKLRVLWIPILDYPASWGATKNMENQYRDLASRGELLAVENVEESVTPGFIRFVKEKLLFQIGGEPIIVSLDQHGRIVHHNAMHMILMRAFDIQKGIRTGVEIGDSIIPFLLQNVLNDRTLAIRSLVSDIDEKLEEIAGNMERVMIEGLDEMQEQIKNPVHRNIYTIEKEKDLWKIETWCTQLLLGVAAETITQWVDENKCIFFIGGNDLKWVEAFISKVKAVVSLNPQLTTMTCYIGSNVKVASVNVREKLCDEGPDGAFESWFIWARLRSTFLSRIKFLDQTYCDGEDDEIVEGLKKILAYEAKDLAVDGWAMLCKGNKIVVCDLGDKMLTVMNEYEKWKENVIAKGFDQAFKDHHEMLSRSIYASKHHPCCALDYPCNFDKVSEIKKCPQCCHNMQKFVTFRCHHGIVDDRDFEDYFN
ncbi:PREDICTED: protein SIEVE ELEMENT OCCLUSION B-like [Ipomoea nil]|uniref:protein SIEVE ELEMENT OCCLUSION B-like n=1 Tax=Ipomoea nil TaxID=35883 RepID=UPI0009008CB9|nr:PREDICTED: protein SIEVE ELEMENT OCCLUSION B-like [Ipomoea nil]